MRFDECLVQARKARGLNQEQLAEKVGVSRQAVSKWETGDAQPDYAKLVALADALEMSLDTLCCRESADAEKETAAGAEKQAPKRRGKRIVLTVVAALLIFACGLFVGMLIRRGGESGMPETVTAVGVNFSRAPDSDLVYYRFVPSAAGEAYRYRLLLRDGDGNEQIFDVECRNGRCAGKVSLTSGKTYTAELIVLRGNESRTVPLAESLRLEQETVLWN